MKKDYVILVDENDKEIGKAEKMEAHEKELLHRAISVFIFNRKGEWLLQRRAFNKYHSKGLWTNTCCSHPAPGETSLQAANRRLQEEMGLAAPLNKLFHFTYKEKLDNHLTEYETDHVFVGITDENPQMNSNEVVANKYLDFEHLHTDVLKNPENYTVWFRKIYTRVNQLIQPSKNQ